MFFFLVNKMQFWITLWLLSTNFTSLIFSLIIQNVSTLSALRSLSCLKMPWGGHILCIFGLFYNSEYILFYFVFVTNKFNSGIFGSMVLRHIRYRSMYTVTTLSSFWVTFPESVIFQCHMSNVTQAVSPSQECGMGRRGQNRGSHSVQPIKYCRQKAGILKVSQDHHELSYVVQ